MVLCKESEWLSTLNFTLMKLENFVEQWGKMGWNKDNGR